MKEMTTKELVKALRCDGINCDCEKCCYERSSCVVSEQLHTASDRLEQQEKRIAELEREFAAAKADLHCFDACQICVGNQANIDGCECECVTCELDCRCKDCLNENKWEWRGAQEGEER